MQKKFNVQSFRPELRSGVSKLKITVYTVRKRARLFERGKNLIAVKFKAMPELSNGIYFLLLTVSFLLSACATTEDFDFIRRDVNQLQKESLMVKNELNTLKEKTSGAAKEESFNVVRQSQAETQSLLSNVSRDLQNLSGRFDENKYFTEKALKNSASEMDIIKAQITSIEDQIKDIRKKMDALESQTKQKKELSEKQQEGFEKPGKEPHEEKQPAKPAAADDKTSKYKAAYNMFAAEKYKEARQMFGAFLKEFPNDELSDNAQFWTAETYYREKDFEGAIFEYEILLKKYPNSQKAPSALLKQGFSFIEMGDKKTGKTILEQLIERYPDSKDADLAKKKIENINKKKTKK
jgi:tol-pal system protein YbgF